MVLLSGARPLTAQNSASCLSALEGVWRGPGSVLGRAIVMEQRWTRALMGNFHELQMRHLPSDTSSRAVFEGRGFYRPVGAASPDSISGVWLDGRGITFFVTGRCSNGAFVSDWSGERERGHTVYTPRANGLEVIDSVYLASGGAREFGRSRLERVSGRP